MDEDSNAESGNNSAKRTKLEKPVVLDNDQSSTLTGNDTTMTASSCITRPVSTSTETNGSVEVVENSGNDCPDEVPMEDVTPGTSSTTIATSTRRGSYRRVGRFARRNYRSQILTSSPSSNDSADVRVERYELRSPEPSLQGDEDTQSVGNVFDDIEDDDDDDDDDDVDEDDDNDSSVYNYYYPNTDSEESTNIQTNVESNSIKDSILGKLKPCYSWSLVHEVMHRENGLSSRGRKCHYGRSPESFQERVYGARHTIEKLKFLHSLDEHDGCVNSLNFNKAGTLLASGSDDLKIILWDWAAKKFKYVFNSGHNSNVFQTKFIDLGGGNDINLVSSGRDGQVRYATIPPGGSTVEIKSRVLLKHSGSVHKISPSPHNPYEILTAGEDGHVVRCDLRENQIERVVTVKVKKRKIPLYSIAHNPLEPQFCVCGRDQFVRIFDKRNTKKPLHMMCPANLENKKSFASHITCAVYNSTGSEVLGSYSENDIYSFNTKLYSPGEYNHRYRGHNNNKTIKGVNYFGLNSEYVVSGSDCGNFFIWDRNTEAILNWKKADFSGVVNCLEPHPSFPVLATSGLDHDIKIWAPVDDKFPPVMEGLERCLKNNTKRSSLRDNSMYDDRTFFFFVRQCLRSRPSTNPSDTNCPSVEDLVSTSSGDDDDDGCDPDDDSLRNRTFPPCTPQ